jgi:hypothetical protein
MVISRPDEMTVFKNKCCMERLMLVGMRHVVVVVPLLPNEIVV